MFENIIYSKTISRPSRSVLDPDLYNEFKKINIDPYEKCKLHSLAECSHMISSDYILIKDCEYFYDIITRINNSPDNVFLIEIRDIYTYPKVQFIQLLSLIFEIAECTFSRFTNVCYIYCKELKYKLVLNKLVVKDFSIKVTDTLIKTVLNYNNKMFKRIINLNKDISSIYNESLDLDVVSKEIDISNNYYISYINKSNTYKICNCDKLFNSKLLKCYICEECFSLNVLEDITS